MVNQRNATAVVRHGLRKAACSSTVLFRALAVALLALSFQHAAAQGAPDEGQPLVIELEQFKVVQDEDGEERLIDVDSVRPGDIIEYRATYRNRGEHKIAGLIAQLPIPEETEYQANSAAPRSLSAEAATEDGVYGPEPLTREVRQPDGNVVEEPVPYVEYRSLRWAIGDLSPGNEIVVKARVEIAPLESQASATSSPAMSSAALAR